MKPPYPFYISTKGFTYSLFYLQGKTNKLYTHQPTGNILHFPIYLENLNSYNGETLKIKNATVNIFHYLYSI